ncbi:metal ABC transporter substrate-binding protein [Candidatus Leptofilum sp.]|uniref:metal ABC transporter substrate-binding protein n=1 Tax=Candidatus Leptofilum sp. TaxID=3241576 RepID=UPI003B5B06E2
MKQLNKQIWILLLLIGAILVVGCSGAGETAVSIQDDHESDHDHETEAGVLTLPELEAAALDGAPLKVVATTSIIGDVVAQVGGEAIELTTLMGPGQDPHSFEPSARALTAVADAHVIFVNGWDLEEALVHDLEEIGGDVPVVAISANIEPLAFGEDVHDDEHNDGHEDEHEDEHAHSGADPHVWFSIHNVEQWVENAEHVLSDLDPANADTFERNAATYLAELAELEAYVASELAQIPEDRRFLATNHGSFSYFAKAYDFTVLGTVIPGNSTVAEPSASDLTDLIETMAEHDVCTIFTEVTVSDGLAQTVAGELIECDEVQVLPLYTGALGLAGSNADSYISMFRTNVDAIVAGLQ